MQMRAGGRIMRKILKQAGIRLEAEKIIKVILNLIEGRFVCLNP